MIKMFAKITGRKIGEQSVEASETLDVCMIMAPIYPSTPQGNLILAEGLILSLEFNNVGRYYAVGDTVSIKLYRGEFEKDLPGTIIDTNNGRATAVATTFVGTPDSDNHLMNQDFEDAIVTLLDFGEDRLEMGIAKVSSYSDYPEDIESPLKFFQNIYKTYCQSNDDRQNLN